MAEVDLFRLGTAAGRSAFSASRRITRTVVVADESPATLLRMVIELAATVGEDEADLSGLKTVSGVRYSAEPGVIVFDIEHRSVHYSQPYAACRTFPALEVGDRHFKLDEIKP